MQRGTHGQGLFQATAKPTGQQGHHSQHAPGLAPSLGRPDELSWSDRSIRPSVHSHQGNSVDWSRYVDGSFEGDDGSDAADEPGADTAAYTGPFSMLEQCQHATGHRHSMQSVQRPHRSPMDAKLQPLIPSPANGNINRSTKQQQQQQQRQQQQHASDWQRQGTQRHAQPQEPLQTGRLLTHQANPLARCLAVHNSGPEQQANAAVGIDLTSSVAGPSTSHSNVSQHADMRSSLGLMDDKENAQDLGRKAAVRKALFGWQESAAEGPAAPAPAGSSAGGTAHVAEQGCSIGSAGDQQQAEPHMHDQESDAVDFSSVFDFL